MATIVGARPQFIKAAAISRAVREQPAIQESLIHTGQHFDQNMSDVFFAELDIPRPAHNLQIHGGTHGRMTGEMLMAIEEVLLTDRPDCVLVYGDTNSTLAGALAAVKLGLPVIHVEAGLRSHLKTQPEEINRVLTDRIASLLLCPTTGAVENLAGEGISARTVHVGDVMYDATLFAAEKAGTTSDILKRLGLQRGGYKVATVHRAENTDDPRVLAKIVTYLEQHAAEQPVVLPLHPRTEAAMARHGLAFKRVMTCNPLGYIDMAALVSASTLVITDSGGLQKEAYFHSVPCVTMRDVTEWVELVEAGWNRLWTEDHYRPRRAIADYSKGDAARRCVEIILESFGPQAG